ncbi:MAG: putative dsRNA-binding protein [Blautia sp.]|nr:putative dsRNA-binding protein [Blautia sp.]
MEKNEFRFIQDQIAYNFKNLDLLQQAFVRRSYSKENGGEDNEILEFIGDKVLDFIVVKYLSEKYGYFLSECDDFDREQEFDEFASEYQENRLTEIKKRLVCKKMLAHRIDVLGLTEFLIMGKDDINNHVQEEDSIKEDLFEAILGAVALDSQWDISELQDVVEIMLSPDSELAQDIFSDYVGLIQDWVSKKNKTIPLYHFEKASYTSTWYVPFNGISQRIEGFEKISRIQFHCLLKIDEHLPIFRGFGISKKEARNAVCRVAYDYLEKHNLVNCIKDEIPNPNKAEAINQLEILARRGYFSIPKYDFQQEYDKNGNPVWKCECCIEEEVRRFLAKSSSKREAKKLSAFKMLEYILQKNNQH